MHITTAEIDSLSPHLLQALNAREAKEMLDVSRQYPKLVAQIVPSPITFEYDATISNIIKAGSLGSLVYVEVRHIRK